MINTGLILSEGEKLIRTYEATYMRALNTNGQLYVTNKRVIYSGKSKARTAAAIVSSEIDIQSVAGVSGTLTKNKNNLLLILAIILLLIALLAIRESFTTTLVLGLVGAFLLYLWKRLEGVHMNLSIISKSVTPAINLSVQTSGNVKSNKAVQTLNASNPGRDAEQMIEELGALILDIQHDEEMAIRKWSQIPMTGPEKDRVRVEERQAKKEEYISNIKEKTVNSAQQIKKTAVSAQTSINEMKEKRQNQGSLKCSCGHVNARGSNFCEQCGNKL